MASLALFFSGAIVASFVGVIASRLHTGRSPYTGRSACDACGAALAPGELVPIFAFFFLKGRTRCCGSRLSLFAPASEILLGILFVLAYDSVGLSSALPLLLLSLSLLLALVLYDFAHHILPFPLLAPFVLASALTGYTLSDSLSAFLSSLGMAAVFGLLLAGIHFASRGRAMGLADAPLVFGLSLLVGPAALPGFVFSFWVGAVIGILLLFERPAGTRMMVEVPFAPYLAAGFLFAYFTQWNPFIFAVAWPR